MGQEGRQRQGKGKDGKKGNSEEKVEKQAVKFEVDRRWSRKKEAQEGGLQDNAGRGRCEKNGKAIGARALGTMGGGGPHPTQTSAVTSMAGSLASTVLVQQVHSCLRHESASAAARALVYQHDGASWANPHGEKPGRHRFRTVGFQIWLDIFSTQLC